MGYRIGSAANHAALFDEVVSFLQSDSDGPGWTLLRENSGGTSALFLAPGLPGTEEIHIGISLHEDAGTDTFALGLWMFKDYNDALEDDEQPGASTVNYLPIWDDVMPFWLVANGQRLIIVAKVSTVYTSAYVGKFFPWGLPGEYKQAYYVGAPAGAATTRWSSTSESVRAFWDPGTTPRILLPSGLWAAVTNFSDASGQEQADTSGVSMWPFHSTMDSSEVRTRYRELRENIDGSHTLWPCILQGDSPAEDVYGDLDGVFAVPAFSAASEDIITVDGIDHLLVQSIHRTSRYYYAAIKLE